MSARRTRCATCGTLFPAPSARKRFCTGSACRSKAHRFPDDLKDAIQRGQALLAEHGTDDQWSAFIAFANSATFDDWAALGESWQTAFANAETNAQAPEA